MKLFLVWSMVVFGWYAATMPVYGALLKIESDFSSVHVGDVLTVSVRIDTQKQVLNAVELEVAYPPDLLEFVSSDAGDSVVTVWLRDTKGVNNGSVSFAGITPGGFTQEDASIVNLTFSVLKKGQGTISISNSQVLVHDGLGSEAVVVSQNLHVVVEEGESTILKKVYLDDEVPELFVPSVEYDVDVFDGDAFLVFSTLDKNSGLSHFEIKEGLFGRYHKAESPYKIKNINQNKKIFIKAIDMNQNERVVIFYPQKDILWYQNEKTIGIIVVLCVLLVTYFIYRRTFSVRSHL